MALGDLNGDGRLDLVSSDGALVYVTLGDATAPGGFAAATNAYSGFATQAIYLGFGAFLRGFKLVDMDGDGHLDVVGLFQTGVSVLFGMGTGAFSGPSTFAVPETSTDLAVADFDGDGSMDVAVTDPNGGITILLGRGSATIDTLTASVEALGLPAGPQRSLDAKLAAAAVAHDRGNTKAAVNKLNAFMNEINAMKGSGRLSAAQADPILALAQQVIAAISGP